MRMKGKMGLALSIAPLIISAFRTLRRLYVKKKVTVQQEEKKNSKLPINR